MGEGDPRREASEKGRREPAPPRREAEGEEEGAIVPAGNGEAEAPAADEEEPASGTESPESEDTDLEGLLHREERERKSLEDKLLRLRAEFDNYRKRQAREFHRLCSAGKRDLIEELLTVLDNVRRAEELSEEGHSADEILAGMFQTAGQLGDILRREGLDRLKVESGDPFDPNVHEAMIAEEVEDAEHDLVLDVFQDGYMLEQELLRPARVKVGKPASGGASDDEDGESGEEEDEQQD
jgi:molecular chaperone GrpE